jgi:hypothetical protein
MLEIDAQNCGKHLIFSSLLAQLQRSGHNSGGRGRWIAPSACIGCSFFWYYISRYFGGKLVTVDEEKLAAEAAELAPAFRRDAK